MAFDWLMLLDGPKLCAIPTPMNGRSRIEGSEVMPSLVVRIFWSIPNYIIIWAIDAASHLNNGIGQAGAHCQFRLPTTCPPSICANANAQFPSAPIKLI